MARTLPFIARPTPAKASLDTQRQTLRIANDLQVLAILTPRMLRHAAHYIANLRERAELSAQFTNPRTAQWR